MWIVSFIVNVVLCGALFWRMKMAPQGAVLAEGFSLRAAKAALGFFCLRTVLQITWLALRAAGYEVEYLMNFPQLTLYLFGFTAFYLGYVLRQQGRGKSAATVAGMDVWKIAVTAVILLIMTVLSFLYAGNAALYGSWLLGDWWLCALLMFGFGLWAPYHWERLARAAKAHYAPVLALTVMIFCVFTGLFMGELQLQNLQLQNLQLQNLQSQVAAGSPFWRYLPVWLYLIGSMVSAIAFFDLVMMKLLFSNPVLDILGEYAPGIVTVWMVCALAFYQQGYLLWLVVLLLTTVSFYQAKRAKKGAWQEDFLSLESSKSVLGICALLIVLHHIAQLLGNLQMEQGAYHFLEYIGVGLVGMFFFFSGFGLMLNTKRRPDYLQHFLRRRWTKVLVPFYFCNTIFVIFALLCGEKPTAGELAAYLSGWVLLNNQMWYVVEIAFLYLVFYLLFRFVKKESAALFLMGVFIGILVLTSILIGHGEQCACDHLLQGEWWFNSTYMFLIGMLAARSRQKWTSFAKKHYPILLVIFFAAAIGLGAASAQVVDMGLYYCEFDPTIGLGELVGIKLLALAVQFSFVFCFVSACLLFSMKVRLYNPLTKSVGRVSLELYLIHYLFLVLFGYLQVGNIADSGALTIAVMAAGLATAYVIHLPIAWISHKIGNERQSKE